MTTVTLSGWQAGDPCEKHELAFCATCREQARMRRTADGLAYENDCAVRAFAALLAVDYAEAVEIVKNGKRLGLGTTLATSTAAFESVGFSLSPTPLDLDGAVAASKTGRRF